LRSECYYVCMQWLGSIVSTVVLFFSGFFGSQPSPSIQIAPTPSPTQNSIQTTNPDVQTPSSDTSPTLPASVQTNPASPNVQITLVASASQIFIGQGFQATATLTNRGTAALTLVDPDFVSANNSWTVDNPMVKHGGGIGIISENGVIPTVTVQPGQMYSIKQYVYINSTSTSPVTFRIGFKSTINSAPVWSNPVTINFKTNEAFPLSITITLGNTQRATEPYEAYMGKTTMGSGVFSYVDATATITNLGNTTQDIGTTDGCGYRGLSDWSTDNDAVGVDVGYSCNATIASPVEELLKPGDSYTQALGIALIQNDATEPVTFRAGIQNIGHQIVWSDPTTVTFKPTSTNQKCTTYQSSGSYKVLSCSQH